jgi:hypothetical protein
MRSLIVPRNLGIALLLAAGLNAMTQNGASTGARPAYLPTGAGSYRIAGTVVNASTGELVRRATVAVLSEADSHTVESVETDNEGHFALVALAASKYQLTASKRGFRTSFYDEHEEYSTAIVTGEGQETGGLVFRLVPGATLRGVVTGDGGDPVEGASMMLFLKPHGHNLGERITRVDEARTDDTGAYEFNNLAPGEYLLAASARPWFALHRADGLRQRSEGDPNIALDVAYPITFFDSTTDEGSATGIALAAGSREEADINLRAVPALHLTVESAAQLDGSTARPELRQTIFGTNSPVENIDSTSAPQTGTIDFIGVAPGHYELTQGNPPRVEELDATTSQRVDPGLGKPSVTVYGSLQSSSGAVLPDSVFVSLSPDSAPAQAALRTACIRGAFNFAAVLPGIWELWADSGGRQLPITSIAMGNRTQAGNLITVRDKPVQVMATVSLGETRLEGFARKAEASGDRKEGKGQAGAMVVLVPKEPAAFRALVRRDQSDSDGSFSLRDVAPGEYTVMAIEAAKSGSGAKPLNEIRQRKMRLLLH